MWSAYNPSLGHLQILSRFATLITTRQELMVLRFGQSVRCLGSLATAASRFTAKVRHFQETNLGSLLECIEGLMLQHEDRLINHYGVALESRNRPEKLWLCLQESSDGPDPIFNHEYRQLPSSAVANYNRFIKELYPKHEALPLNRSQPQVMDIVNNSIKYHNVNHYQLYKSYCELPSPRPLYLSPSILQVFINKFLFNKSDFIKPNVISASYLDLEKLPALVLNNASQMLSRRTEYFDMVCKILDDVKSCGIPLTPRQQVYLTYISFFKDRSDVANRILAIDKDFHANLDKDSAIKITYPEFNFPLYSQLKTSLPFHIDSYNVLLFHGIRHSNQAVIDDILSIISLDPSQKEDTSTIKPNSRTLRLLIDHFSSPEYLRSSRSLSPLVDCIEYLTNSNMIIDIKIINLVIKSLILTNNITLAENLISTLSYYEDTNSESIMSMQLTAEDKYTYNQLMKVFTNIKTITSDPTTFNIVPSESTFVPFVKYYCETGSVEKTKYILNLIQSYKIPLSSRILRQIFTSIINHPWNISDLFEITGAVVSLHDHSYNLSHDNSLNKLKAELTPALKAFMENHLKVPNENSFPNDRRNFIKLSDDFIDTIYQAFVVTIKREEYDAALVKEITEHKNQLQDKLEEVRGDSPKLYEKTATRRSIYLNDEINYLKKGFLIDLINIVEDNLEKTD